MLGVGGWHYLGAKAPTIVRPPDVGAGSRLAVSMEKGGTGLVRIRFDWVRLNWIYRTTSDGTASDRTVSDGTASSATMVDIGESSGVSAVGVAKRRQHVLKVSSNACKS
jgi:hypothetical protein